MCTHTCVHPALWSSELRALGRNLVLAPLLAGTASTSVGHLDSLLVFWPLPAPSLAGSQSSSQVLRPPDLEIGRSNSEVLRDRNGDTELPREWTINLTSVDPGKIQQLAGQETDAPKMSQTGKITVPRVFEEWPLEACPSHPPITRSPHHIQTKSIRNSVYNF